MNIFNQLPDNWNSLSDDARYQLTLEDQIARFESIQLNRTLRSHESSQLDSLRTKLANLVNS